MFLIVVTMVVLFLQVLLLLQCISLTLPLPYVITGASSDFDGATKIAKMMVTRFGMSDKVIIFIYGYLVGYVIIMCHFCKWEAILNTLALWKVALGSPLRSTEGGVFFQLGL